MMPATILVRRHLVREGRISLVRLAAFGSILLATVCVWALAIVGAVTVVRAL